ncbi:hypothetical protein D3C85_1282200 [compost metagenome]
MADRDPSALPPHLAPQRFQSQIAAEAQTFGRGVARLRLPQEVQESRPHDRSASSFARPALGVPLVKGARPPTADVIRIRQGRPVGSRGL